MTMSADDLSCFSSFPCASSYLAINCSFVTTSLIDSCIFVMADDSHTPYRHGIARISMVLSNLSLGHRLPLQFGHSDAKSLLPFFISYSRFTEKCVFISFAPTSL